MVWPRKKWNFEGAVVGHNGRAEMTAAGDIRDPAAMREELADLLDYLNGLPDEIRRGGAFIAYEQRAGELSRELVVTDMLLTLNLPGKFLNEPTKTNDYGRMYESLTALTEQYRHVAERGLRASRTLQWAVVATTAGSLVSALTTATVLVLPFSGVAASLAGVYVCWFMGRARKQEQAATRLSILREVINHSFGPSGQVLRPSEYYSASTKRIESLLDEIRATVGQT
jgi:hypothetical protein